MASHDTSARADVELRLPADGAFASLLRTTTAALAARLDFTMDDIEDLRIAIGEAGALVLPEADPGADLVCKYFLGSGSMTVQVETASSGDPVPDYDSFAWQVLDTLASEASVVSAGGVFIVRFSMANHLGAVDAAEDPAGADA